MVVMGHTHHAKRVKVSDGKFYLNSGTWADVIRLDESVFSGDDAALAGWWRSSPRAHRTRSAVATYASGLAAPYVFAMSDGRVAKAEPQLYYWPDVPDED